VGQDGILLRRWQRRDVARVSNAPYTFFGIAVEVLLARPPAHLQGVEWCTPLAYRRDVSEIRRRFEWDERKNEVNQKKHGVSFEVAKRVFDDPNVVLFVERVEGREERWHAIGYVDGSVLFLTVVHTYIENHSGVVIRIVSARRATRYERKIYAEANL
jgi:uncharacterized DUF497 family protein